MNTYDFSNGKQGAVVKTEPEVNGKTDITIRLDADILSYFMDRADESGGKISCETLLNEALKEYIREQSPTLEKMFRRVLREELARHR